MEDKNGKSSKQAILDAATEVFAEKGFDGARVDEIARRAQVNKALIYYYFESKDKILAELMVGLIREMIDLKDQLTKNQNDLDLKQFFDSTRIDDFIYQAFDFFKQHRLLLNIILSEALKGATSKDVFFEMLGLSLKDGVGRIKQMNGEINDFEEFSTIAVFFAFMPMLNFISFGENWAEYNHLDYQVIEAKYYQTFKRLYRDYFLTAFFPKK